jgi:LysM repeat protein
MKRLLLAVLVAVLLVPLVAQPSWAGPPRSDPVVHIVQWGESLISIARRYGTTVEAIVQANNIANRNRIYAGQRLVIPGTTTQPTPTPQPGGECSYVVQRGDTLYGIAARYGTTVTAIALANHIVNPSRIYVGQQLTMPCDGAPSPTPTPGTQPTPTSSPSPSPSPTPEPGGTYYTVRGGDTLTGIAVRYGVTVWAIVQANNLSNPNVIYPGQRLYIPTSGSPSPPSPPSSTPTPVPTSAPQPPGPAPSGYGYGVQAHAFGQESRVGDAVRDLGFGWVKQQVRWNTIESSKGNYNWSALDDVADACKTRGISVLFSVVAAPGWARSGKSGIGPPNNYQDLYDFVGAMAGHFKGRVQAYEIWNEQNLQREWEGSALNAADYVRLLKGSYQAIKAADPNAIVVSGAPTPTGINDGVWAIDDRVYLQQMYNAGLRYYADAIGAHPSGYANPPDIYYAGGDYDPNRGYDDHGSFFFRNTMEDYYRIMANNGDGGKRIWATEFGWPTTDGMGVSPNPGYEFAGDINESQQADYIVRAYTWSRGWGHAGVMFLWNLNFWPVSGAANEMAKYGIVRGDWSPRPAYVALKNMAK